MEPQHNEEVVVCEGDYANFSCPEGKYISLNIANYGRFSLGICNKDGVADWSTTCQNSQTLGILQDFCDGRRVCKFLVDERWFERDPCPGVSKYLEASYSCLRVTTSTTTEFITSSTPIAVTTITTTTIAEKLGKIDSVPSSSHFVTSTNSKACGSRNARGIGWPVTSAGEMARVNCPLNAVGEAKWFCNFDGTWNFSYDLSGCVSEYTKEYIMTSDAGSSFNDDTLSDIISLLNSSCYGGDFIYFAYVLNTTTSILNRAKNKTEIFKLIVDIVSKMFEKNQELTWNDLLPERRRKVANSLMDTIEAAGAIVALSLSNEARVKAWETNSAVFEISNVEVKEYVKFPRNNISRDSVDLPQEALEFKLLIGLHLGDARVIYASYKTVQQYMFPKPRVMKDGSIIRRMLGSNVVSVSLVGRDGAIKSAHEFNTAVVLTFTTKDRKDFSSPSCVWWNSEIMEWSQEGCRLQKSNHSHTVCNCYHLTHFAVIMDFRGDSIPERHEIILTALTYAGCTLSIICLFFAIIVFQCFGRRGGDRTFIHKNLCLSLLVAEGTFLFGIWQTENKFYCSIIAALLHYSFLVALMWMLLEGVELYRMLVEVFSVSSRKLYFFLVGFGCPAIVVGISMWADFGSYGTNEYCWLKPGSNCFMFAFTVPVSGVMFFNFAFLIMTFRIVGKSRNSPVRYKCKDGGVTTLEDIGKWVKGATALIFLLGLTWIFGFFWVNGQNILFAYLFTIFNALQGFSIFILHVVYNDRLQDDIREWARHSSWAPRCLRGSSKRLSTAPYMPGSRMPYNPSSNSSTGSDLLRLKILMGRSAEYSPLTESQRAGICPNYNRRGVYDYATIPYETMCSQPFLQSSYFNQVKQYPMRPFIYNEEAAHFRPPPNFPPPPPPAPGVGGIVNSPRPHSSTLTKVSDDSAYSDGSSNFHFPSESNSSGMLLRMDLTRNPPVFVEGI
uniref:Latrophilin Cirl n=1 Tax=Syphacia muris TaxID=451379 RepID=A0A158R432_9BILA